MVAPTLKPPQQNRSRKAANALLQAGRQGIETRGIAGLSMADVAAEAGASVGSLYFRFGNKSQFVGAALAVALEEFAIAASNFADPGGPKKMDGAPSATKVGLPCLSAWSVTSGLSSGK